MNKKDGNLAGVFPGRRFRWEVVNVSSLHHERPTVLYWSTSLSRLAIVEFIFLSYCYQGYTGTDRVCARHIKHALS